MSCTEVLRIFCFYLFLVRAHRRQVIEKQQCDRGIPPQDRGTPLPDNLPSNQSLSLQVHISNALRIAFEFKSPDAQVPVMGRVKSDKKKEKQIKKQKTVELENGQGGAGPQDIAEAIDVLATSVLLQERSGVVLALHNLAKLTECTGDTVPEEDTSICDFTSPSFPACVRSQPGTTQESQRFLMESWEKAGTSFELREPNEKTANELYFLTDEHGVEIGIFKPRKNDDGHGPGIAGGGHCTREVAAYLVDYYALGGKANVPETALVRMEPHGSGSLQKFVHDTVPLLEYTGEIKRSDIRHMAMLDLMMWNNDRHGYNLLVFQGNTEGGLGRWSGPRSGRAIAIDNGQSLWAFPNIWYGGYALPMMNETSFTLAIEKASSERLPDRPLHHCPLEELSKQLVAVGLSKCGLISFLLATDIVAKASSHSFSDLRRKVAALGNWGQVANVSFPG